MAAIDKIKKAIKSVNNLVSKKGEFYNADLTDKDTFNSFTKKAFSNFGFSQQESRQIRRELYNALNEEEFNNESIIDIVKSYADAPTAYSEHLPGTQIFDKTRNFNQYRYQKNADGFYRPIKEKPSINNDTVDRSTDIQQIETKKPIQNASSINNDVINTTDSTQSNLTQPTNDINTSGFGNPRKYPIESKSSEVGKKIETPSQPSINTETKTESSLRSGGNNPNTQSGSQSTSTQSGSSTETLNVNSLDSSLSALDKAAQKKGTANKHLLDRTKQEFQEVISKMQYAKQTQDSNEMRKLISKYGSNNKDIENYFVNQLKQGPNAIDYMWGYKMPQTVAGLGLLYGMGSMALGNSKGQKTNAELYSNPF